MQDQVATTCLCSGCNRVRSWLDAAADRPQADGEVRDDSGETKPRPKAMPPTPPDSSLPPQPPPPRSQPPLKRRRLDLEGAENSGEEATTPMSRCPPNNLSNTNEVALVSLQQSLARSLRVGCELTQQQPLPSGLSDNPRPAVTRGRPPKQPLSTSPVERIDQLQNLRPPIRYVPINDDPKAQLPQDVQGLFESIKKVVKYRTGFIPAAARELAMRKDPEAREWPSIYFFEPESQDSQLWTPDSESDVEAETGEKYVPTAVGRANKEFMMLRKLQRAAAEALRMGHSESAWNASVHTPLLELAVRSRRGVALEQITTAAVMHE
ncbi:hypothetical protein MAPG_10448, partial [Magnaporthiopsis poae ATCC 64411]